MLFSVILCDKIHFHEYACMIISIESISRSGIARYIVYAFESFIALVRLPSEEAERIYIPTQLYYREVI